MLPLLLILADVAPLPWLTHFSFYKMKKTKLDSNVYTQIPRYNKTTTRKKSI